MQPLSIRIKDFSRTRKVLDSDDEKCVVLHKLLDAWAEAALKLETALHDARQQAAARKIEAGDLRRQRDMLRDDGEKSRGGEV